MLPFQHGLQNRPSRCAGNIAGYRGQFDIGVFERLLDAIDQPCTVGCQTTAVARQVPLYPLRHKPGGTSDAQGEFVLTTYTQDDGAPAGEYAVTVVWRRPWTDAAGKPGPNLLPERYSKPDTSELRVRVKEGVNELTLELKK